MKDKLYLRLRKWVTEFQYRHGQEPETIPMTVAEVREIEQSPHCHGVMHFPIPAERPQFFGCSVEETDFAESLRMRRLELPLILLGESVRFAAPLTVQDQQAMTNEVTRHFKVRICGQQSAFEVTFSVDPFYDLKTRLAAWRFFPAGKLAERFLTWLAPARQMKTQIKAEVLYPYLKIELPHNRHTVRFTQACPDTGTKPL